jgi:hypothetical protein
VVDDNGLENRIPVMSGDVGSNPTASAKSCLSTPYRVAYQVGTLEGCMSG